MALYLDDSGTRYPDRATGNTPEHGRDWFALGGVIVKDQDETTVRAAHAKFCSSWGFTTPLHSQEIRARTKSFTWLAGLPPSEWNRFMRELTRLVTVPELTAIACVIDRPGYNSRYSQQYGSGRWLLCKTAFSVVVERAAKFARRNGCKLRVYVEHSDAGANKAIRGYYEELRTSGPPFDAQGSSKYAPLGPLEMRETLYDFKIKEKSSPLIQLADLALWPMCIGGYNSANIPFQEMLKAGTLIDSKLPPGEAQTSGIKYSCMPPLAA